MPEFTINSPWIKILIFNLLFNVNIHLLYNLSYYYARHRSKVITFSKPKGFQLFLKVIPKPLTMNREFIKQFIWEIGGEGRKKKRRNLPVCWAVSSSSLPSTAMLSCETFGML